MPNIFKRTYTDIRSWYSYLAPDDKARVAIGITFAVFFIVFVVII